MKTSADYSPWNLLPAPEPKTQSYPLQYFYDNVAKHLIKDTVRIMMNGLPIDLQRVRELEDTLDSVLAEVEKTLANNPIINKYLEQRYSSQIAKYKSEQESKKKPLDHFLKEFKPSDMVHRSYFIEAIRETTNWEPPEDVLPTGIPKWTVKDARKLSHPAITKLLANTVDGTNKFAVQAMHNLATDKQALYNKSYEDKIEAPTIPYPTFNPASSKQKQELFDMLGLISEKTSKDTGLPSWDRDEVERINKNTSDPILQELTQAMIDHSFGAIVKNNFINAFYQYTIDGRLYGTYKLFGAKSFRYTSNSPNMLNMPSTGSIYAKPIKRCLVAPEGYIIYAIDLSALEDRVIASLSRDHNKISIFTEGLDGHCLNAYGYFKEEVAEHMELTGDTPTDVRKFFDLQEHGHKELKAIRQKGKPATFGLSYGAYPNKVANTLKIPLDDAQSIFDRYHGELYAGITDYRENYVLPTAKENGTLHLGLGCTIKTDAPDRDIRTLNNATCQFWSIVTSLTINKIHQLQGDRDIECISTIYDSIYYVVKDDADTIKWLNDTIVPIITKDFMIGQAVPNEAAGEIGYDWATLELVPNEATLEDIKEIQRKLND